MSLDVPWGTCPISGGKAATKSTIQDATCKHLFDATGGLYTLDEHADKANMCTKMNANISAIPQCYKLTSKDYSDPVKNGVIEALVDYELVSSDECPSSSAMPVFEKVEPSAKSCFEASLDTLTDALKLDVDTCGKTRNIPKCEQKTAYVLQMPDTFTVHA